MSHTESTMEGAGALRRYRRLVEKPTLDHWGDHEALTLTEAFVLNITDGALSPKGLRLAVKKGEIASSEVAGKIWITKHAVREAFAPKPKMRGEIIAKATDADAPPAEERPAPKTSMAMTKITAENNARRARRRLANLS